MRAIVALVETRPETVAHDMERVLGLAGFPSRPELPSKLVLDTGPGGGWFPGAAATPWQLEAGCSRFAAGTAPTVFGLQEGGAPSLAPDPALEPVLRRAGADWADDQAWRRKPVHVAEDLPVLSGLLGGRLTVPAELHGEPLALLPVPAVGGGWPVAGAVALLAGILAPPQRREWRGRRTSFLFEVVRLARECLHVSGVLMDGTVWSVGDGPGRRGCVQGNVLLAGNDPVAVDAVACRLAGVDPRRVPWLRACAAAGLGHGDPRDIRIVGREDLVDLGLELPSHVLAPSSRLAARRSLRAAAWRWLGRPAILRRHRISPWGSLRDSLATNRSGRQIS